MGAENLNPARREQRDYSSRLISEGLTEREKRALSESIDKSILSRPATDPGPDDQTKGSRYALMIPILINAGALLIVAAVFVLFTMSFQERRYRMELDESKYYSTEGKILEAYKRESDQKLREKDNLIYRILKQLEFLESQKEEMGRLMDINIVRKREILDDEIAKSRSVELERLKALGYDEEKISGLMTDYDEAAAEKRDSEIVSYQEQSMKLLKDRERALIAEINAKEQSLRIATEGVDVEGNEIDPDTRAALDELTMLSETRERETLLMDQINASFLKVLDRISAYDTEGALSSLSSLRLIYSQTPLQDLPYIADRYKVDLSVIETLESFIRQRQAWVETPVTIVAEDLDPEDSETSSEVIELRSKIQTLQDQLSNQEQRIAFLSVTNSEKDDTIEDLAWKLDKSLEMVEIEAAKGLETGRNLAFDDIQSILRAYEGLDTAEIVSAMSDEGDVVFSDEKIGAVYEKFTDVLRSFALSYSEIQASFKLIGTVSLITGNRVVIEPLVAIDVMPETPMEIRRVNSGGTYRVVAKGKVLSAVPGKITATVTYRPSRDISPDVNDQVYISPAVN